MHTEFLKFVITALSAARAGLRRVWLPSALLLCCWAASCSSVPSYGGVPQQLSINILPNNSKQFVYRLGQAAERPRETLARAPRYVPDRYDYKKLQRRTAYVVAASGYCRNGYMELDFRLNMQQQWLRGECKEGASEADIKTYAGQTVIALDDLGE